MGIIGLRVQRHVSSVTVELPHQTRILVESTGGCEGYCIVFTPQSSGASEGWKSAGGRDAGSKKGGYPLTFREMLMEISKLLGIN